MIDLLFMLLWAHGDASVALDLDPMRAVAGATVRLAQAILEGAPYLLGGVALSGLLRGVVGDEPIRRWFGTPSLGGVIRASTFGFVLPLGALGALPVARRLLATGVPRGSALAFFLAAAVLDPLTVLFGLSQMDTRSVLGCVVGALAWALACGLLVNRFAPGDARPVDETTEPLPMTAPGRLIRVVSRMAAELSGPSLRDLALAATGAGLLGAFLPHGWLDVAASPARPAGSLVAGGVVSIASETPVEAMRQAGALLRDGYGHRIAFVLLAFGSGLNLAALVWLRRGLGLRLAPLAGVIGIGLLSGTLLGWSFDRGRRAVSPGDAFHTHAFDEIGRPNLTGQGVRQLGANAWSVLEKGGAHRLSALTPILLLAALGGIARRPRIRETLTRWASALETPRPGTKTRAWERPLSSRWIAASGLAAAVPAFAALILTYYPAPAEIFSEMTIVSTEAQVAVRLGQVEDALPWMDRWEALARKLGPATILRRGSLDASAERTLDELLDTIEALRGFLEDGRIEEARTLLGPIGQAQRGCRQAFEASG